jgi:hypothetical protein
MVSLQEKHLLFVSGTAKQLTYKNNTMATIKKAQFGKLIKEGAEKAAGKTAPKSFKLEGSMIKDVIKKKEREALKEKMRGWDKEMIGQKKAKNGKSFPDLNKDGKVTKADILKGRGVIAKNGAKKKMQAGGVVKSTKRVGSVDPKGAYTKVQKRTLAGAKTKASLTKDKQLGATKMAKGGACMSKKK